MYVARDFVHIRHGPRNNHDPGSNRRPLMPTIYPPYVRIRPKGFKATEMNAFLLGYMHKKYTHNQWNPKIPKHDIVSGFVPDIHPPTSFPYVKILRVENRPAASASFPSQESARPTPPSSSSFELLTSAAGWPLSVYLHDKILIIKAMENIFLTLHIDFKWLA